MLEAERKSFEAASVRDQDFVRRNVEAFRNRRAASINNVQVEAIRALWDNVVASYRVRLLIRGLRTVNINTILERSGEDDVKQLIKNLSFGLNIDEYTKDLTDNNINRYRPFVSTQLWECFGAYSSVQAVGLMVAKSVELGVGSTDIIDFDVAVREVKKIVPAAQDGFEKYGWPWIFFTDDLLEDRIIFEIRKFVEGGEVDSQQIAAVTSLTQTINQQMSAVTNVEIPADLKNQNLSES